MIRRLLDIYRGIPTHARIWRTGHDAAIAAEHAASTAWATREHDFELWANELGWVET